MVPDLGRHDLTTLARHNDVRLDPLVDAQDEADRRILVHVADLVEPVLGVGLGADNLASLIDDWDLVVPAVGHEHLV